MRDRLVILALALALAVVACGRAAPPVPGVVEVHNAWARPADSGLVSAVYLSIVNRTSSPVSYKGASSPLATDVSLHETMEMSGMVHMMPLDTVPPIAPGDSLVLTEGAKHLMVSGLRRRIAAGDTLPIIITLRDGSVLHVNAVVRTP
jgi:hypothetical protein